MYNYCYIIFFYYMFQGSASPTTSAQAGWQSLMRLIARQTALLHLKPLPKAICQTLSPFLTPRFDFDSMFDKTYLHRNHNMRIVIALRIMQKQVQRRKVLFVCCLTCYKGHTDPPYETSSINETTSALQNFATAGFDHHQQYCTCRI